MSKRSKSRIAGLLALLLCLGLAQPALAAKLDAQASPSALAAAGEVTLTINVHNDGAFAMENLRISSAYSGIEFNTQGAAIEPGSSRPFSVAVGLSEAALGQALTFDVSWTENGEAKSGAASVTVQKQASASLTASFSASKTQASQGEVVTLTYTLTNTGSIPVTVTSVVDKGVSSKPIAEKVTVEPGSPLAIPFEYTMGAATVTSAPVITYIDSMGATQTLTLKETTLGMVMSKLSVEVTEGEPSVNGVPFSLLLTNNGNQKISAIQVKDELGNKVNGAEFALAIGESRQLSYTVLSDAERYVVFTVTGKSASGEAYENTTKSYVVRKYIDPALLGIEFNAAVVETLNAAGSIKVRFSVNNTGSLDMSNLVISEKKLEKKEGEEQPVETLAEITRQESVAPGLFETEQAVYVGEPRELTFVVTLNDPAGNIYTYTAYITADSVGVYDGSGAEAVQQEVIEGLGERIGTGISRALSVALVVLAVLIVLAAIALAILSQLERKQKREAARRRARREKQRREQLRQQQADAADTIANRPIASTPVNPGADLGDTQIRRHPRDLGQ